MAYQRLGDQGLAPGVPWTVENLLEKLIEHEKIAPGHGINCSCMDDYAREFENLLWGFRTNTELTDEQRIALHDRMKHILRMLSRY